MHHEKYKETRHAIVFYMRIAFLLSIILSCGLIATAQAPETDSPAQKWTIDPGKFVLRAGNSSGNTPPSADITLK